MRAREILFEMSYDEAIRVWKSAGVADPSRLAPTDLKKQRNALIKQHHPDKQGGDEELSKQINAAYDVLASASGPKNANAAPGRSAKPRTKAKPFNVSDLFGNEPPHEPEDMYLHRDAQWGVMVRWYAWGRLFSLDDLDRMFKLTSGDGFEAVDGDRSPNPAFPPPIWAVARLADQFVLRFSNWYVTRDDNGQEVHTCPLGYIEYGLPMDELAGLHKQLRAKTLA